jgi:2-polyprenyl-3-methyl-5-hydroxy-6-metoxy-1,4-benzoquinol methylase
VSSFDPDENIRVLDIACGSGRHSVALAIEGADVIGVESKKGATLDPS